MERLASRINNGTPHETSAYGARIGLRSLGCTSHRGNCCAGGRILQTRCVGVGIEALAVVPDDACSARRRRTPLEVSHTDTIMLCLLPVLIVLPNSCSRPSPQS